jgi:hypothetical protein
MVNQAIRSCLLYVILAFSIASVVVSQQSSGWEECDSVSEDKTRLRIGDWLLALGIWGLVESVLLMGCCDTSKDSDEEEDSNEEASQSFFGWQCTMVLFFFIWMVVGGIVLLREPGPTCIQHHETKTIYSLVIWCIVVSPVAFALLGVAIIAPFLLLSSIESADDGPDESPIVSSTDVASAKASEAVSEAPPKEGLTFEMLSFYV